MILILEFLLWKQLEILILKKMVNKQFNSKHSDISMKIKQDQCQDIVNYTKYQVRII